MNAMIPLQRAQDIAAKVVDALRPFCVRIEVAGSIRRQRPEIGDIDLVMQVRDKVGLEQRITRQCKLAKSGDQYLVAIMPDSTQLDLWFSYTPRVSEQRWMFADTDRKSDNFGSILLSRTGSTAHNMMLCERAKKLGRHWNPHWGVYQNGICIASETEADIYTALALEYIEPTEREFAGRGEQLRLINRPQTAPV